MRPWPPLKAHGNNGPHPLVRRLPLLAASGVPRIGNHELRTPITLIAGHAEDLLRRGPQPPALLLIQQEAQRMGTLITNLLDLARNDAGRLRLQACAEAPAASPITLAASTGPAGELVLHVRGSAGLASPRRGSGIGLSVVRLLIEAMGGRVQVADHPGGGADFQQLLLPLAGDPG